MKPNVESEADFRGLMQSAMAALPKIMEDSYLEYLGVSIVSSQVQEKIPLP